MRRGARSHVYIPTLSPPYNLPMSLFLLSFWPAKHRKEEEVPCKFDVPPMGLDGIFSAIPYCLHWHLRLLSVAEIAVRHVVLPDMVLVLRAFG